MFSYAKLGTAFVSASLLVSSFVSASATEPTGEAEQSFVEDSTGDVMKSGNKKPTKAELASTDVTGFEVSVNEIAATFTFKLDDFKAKAGDKQFFVVRFPDTANKDGRMDSLQFTRGKRKVIVYTYKEQGGLREAQFCDSAEVNMFYKRDIAKAIVDIECVAGFGTQAVVGNSTINSGNVATEEGEHMVLSDEATLPQRIIFGS